MVEFGDVGGSIWDAMASGSLDISFRSENTPFRYQSTSVHLISHMAQAHP